jgi:endogenous inhibitor of DNA gyrase (YacG/DUF329 family)
MKKGEKRPDLQRARIAKCPICDKEFRAVKEFEGRITKYCSKECWANRGSKKKNIECLRCGKIFSVGNNIKSKVRTFCSRECSYAYKVGEKSNTYKDGKSLERERGRDSYELSKWRKEVFKRDNYLCKKCGKEGYLHAHHIKHYADNTELRFDINNGITLCEKCHGEIHNRNFANKRVKSCISCEAKITGKGKSGLCRSCAIIKWHKDNPKTIAT